MRLLADKQIALTNILHREVDEDGFLVGHSVPFSKPSSSRFAVWANLP